MSQTVMDKMSSTPLNDFDSGNFKVHVKNFGPIESAEVDLKPLTVFVGKSNTGKTYLATLIYALHEALGGFPRLPYFPRSDILHILKTWEDQGENSQEYLANFINKLTETPQVLNFGDFPSVFSDILFSDDAQRKSTKKSIITGILKTFGESEIYALCRKNEKSSKLSIKFGYSEKNSDVWCAEIKGSKYKTSFRASLLRDIQILNAATPHSENLFENQEFYRELQYSLYRPIRRIMEIMSYPKLQTPNYVYYLPAVRSGIMQSHKFIASTGLDQLHYGGLEDTHVIPRLPKISIDFIKCLLSINDNSPGFYRAPKSRKDCISSVADKFEELVLGGYIESHTEFDQGYPEIYFKQTNDNNEFTLNQSSSMVSELAPIVLFIRHFVQKNDLLILEEPEAHLHPGAQVKIAQCLALLIRNGVNVIVTTHSDWFLKCIQKLIIQGKLTQLMSVRSNDELNSYLLENEVGVWNFIDGAHNLGTKVKKIEFREDVGVEPQEIEDLALSLYNDVIRDRNDVARIMFKAENEFTPRDIAERLMVSVDRVRQKFRQFGIKPIKGNRHVFNKREFDNLCKRLADEFKLDVKI